MTAPESSGPHGTGPLEGKVVVITRSRAQAGDLADRLAAAGAEVLEFPTIEQVDPESWEPADEAIRNLQVYDWLIFTSVNAVERFFGRMEVHDVDARQLAGCRVAAVGPATAVRLKEHGIRADFVPDDHRAEGVLAGLAERGAGSGTRVLIPRALEAREVLPETLRRCGATVDVAPVYRTVRGAGAPGVVERLAAGGVDAITFTSASTVRNFLDLLEERLPEGVGMPQLLSRVVIASIGPVTSEYAQERGVPVTVEPVEYTVPALVEALGIHFAEEG